MTDDATLAGDIYAQLDRFDKRISCELEDLKRMLLLFANPQQPMVGEGGVAKKSVGNEQDSSNHDGSLNDNNKDARSESQSQVAQQQQQIVGDRDTKVESRSSGLQRHSQRGASINYSGMNGSTRGFREPKPIPDQKKQKPRNRPNQKDESNNANDKHQRTIASYLSSTDRNTHPNNNIHVEGSGIGARRRRARQRYQELVQLETCDDPDESTTKNNCDEYTPTSKPKKERVKEEEGRALDGNKVAEEMDAAQIHALKDGPGEGRGRRARARRSPVRREQQKEGDKESLATASIRKKYNLSIEQKQRIIDSLNVARNDFLSR